MPLLNRARLFLHDLLCRKGLEWDDKLPDSDLSLWSNICKQFNSSPKIEVERCFGGRNDAIRLARRVFS